MPPVVPRPHPGPHRPRRAAALGLLLLLTAVPACTTDPRPRPGGPAAGATASAAAPALDGGAVFWVDPGSEAARQVLAWEARGRYGDAQVLRRIADRPVALWGRPGDPGPAIRRARAGAKAAGRTLVLAAHHIPHRDCGRQPAGGAPDAAAYRRWIGAFADAIGDADALVVLEPHAVAHAVEGCVRDGRRTERYRLLSEAVDRLKRNPRTKVYLDAGGPDRVRDPADLAGPLREAGLDRADGFALNVSGYRPDAEVRAYGAQLSRATGGRHYVVDTGRNGAGTPPGDRARAGCNPPGRALGTPPTDRTGDPLVDAYLWVRRPGESDGTCRGGPEAGTWWPEQALGLARRARDTPP
ncbi:glycoside hydrolase family 6 protein [Streptomyces sp. NRRL F-2664]|uniref:glycoside hydrolase family 6 protein n=1 Tax=Streptomyces sp. NRRL F-2664 TaxID=1463842 RepID=UPI0006896D2E|nr:glycoside hydrolase family 6 protein [Streptomyces sp. NRRL F-2664]